LKKALSRSFEVKDLGYLHYFLGIEVAYGVQGVVVGFLLACGIKMAFNTAIPFDIPHPLRFKSISLTPPPCLPPPSQALEFLKGDDENGV